MRREVKREQRVVCEIKRLIKDADSVRKDNGSINQRAPIAESTLTTKIKSILTYFYHKLNEEEAACKCYNISVNCHFCISFDFLFNKV